MLRKYVSPSKNCVKLFPSPYDMGLRIVQGLYVSLQDGFLPFDFLCRQFHIPTNGMVR